MLLQDILSEDHQQFNQLEQRFRALFPYVRRIRLRRVPGFRTPPTAEEEASPSSMGLGIYFDFEAGKEVLPAANTADGLLLILAYLALLFSPQRPRLLLI